MEIVERKADGVTILDLHGRLILGDGDKPFSDKINALVRQGHRKLLVNLEHVSYLDSAGVGTLVWKFVTLRKQGGSLKLLNLSKRSHSVLLVTKLLTVLETFESETEAVKSF